MTTTQARPPQPYYVGHRRRLRQRIAESGTESFLDHELLEIILACVIARKDTKEMAWELVRRFKNVSGVFEASREELLTVPGIGPKSAQLLVLFRPACAAYLKNRLFRRNVLNNPQLVADFCRLRLAGKSHEMVHVLYVNDRNHLLAEKTVSLGGINESPVYPRRVVEEALACHASGFAFYNTSRYDFEKLLDDAPGLAANLKNYINGFSDNMREVLEKFDFNNTIAKLEETGLLFKDRGKFEKELDKAIKTSWLKLSAPLRKTILAALSEHDETAEICRDDVGHPEPDSDLRDTENVPLGEDINAYFDREVKPHVPDAWVNAAIRDHKDSEVGKVGYEFNFNRYFYKYQPPRPLEEIESDIKTLEKEIMGMLSEVTR